LEQPKVKYFNANSCRKRAADPAPAAHLHRPNRFRANKLSRLCHDLQPSLHSLNHQHLETVSLLHHFTHPGLLRLISTQAADLVLAAVCRSSTASKQPIELGWSAIVQDLAIGGGWVPGRLRALVGVAGWRAGMASWVLLWDRSRSRTVAGWQPGYRELRVDQVVGWRRVWPAFGLTSGAELGGFFGHSWGWGVVVRVFLGLLLGAWLGFKAGHKLWQAGSQLGWERIWAGVGALSAALFGWRIAAWLGAGSISIHLAGSLSAWITSQSASLLLVSLVIGTLGGALGGAVSGTLADLFARLFNLLD
jgi:hypothetical protein